MATRIKVQGTTHGVMREASVVVDGQVEVDDIAYAESRARRLGMDELTSTTLSYANVTNREGGATWTHWLS